LWRKSRFLTKITIFDQNPDFWPKSRFLSKITIFDQNHDFWPKSRFLTKIPIFDQNWDFILQGFPSSSRHFWFPERLLGSNLGSDLDFRPKFREICIFWPDFLPKNLFLPRYRSKIWNFDFRTKTRCSTKNISDQHLSF